MTKKILITLVLLLFLITGCNSKNTFNGGYAIVYLEGVPYLLNAKGETKDLSQYDEIDSQFGSLMIVKQYKNNKILCGYIDNNGNEVIKPSYEMAYPFSEGLAVVVEKGQYQIINTNNKVVYTLPEGYIAYDQFVEGYLRVEHEGQYTFLSKDFVLGTSFFENLENFSCGLALTSYKDANGNTNYQFINPNYEIVITSEQLKQYDFIDSFHDNYARVGRYINSTYYYSFINNKAELLVDEEDNSLFLKANNFHNGQAVIYTETPYRKIYGVAGDVISQRYCFRYLTTEGKYPAYLLDGGKYGFYKEYEIENSNINEIWATFEPYVPGYIAVREFYSGNPKYTYYKVTDEGVEVLNLSTNDESISKLDRVHYNKTIELLSFKINTFYDPTNPQLLMVVKIYTNLYGIVNQNGEYITKVIYDNIVI